MQLFQILGDCPHCRVDGAVVELYDQFEPCCHLGVALDTHCRLCQRRTHGRAEVRGQVVPVSELSMAEELCPSCRAPLTEEFREARACGNCGLRAWSDVVHDPVSLADRDAIEAALKRWAAEDGFEDTEELLDSSFVDPTLDGLMAAMAAGQKIETSFDVLGFLFSHMGGGAGGGQPAGAAVDHDALVQAQEVVARGSAPRGVPPTLRIKLPQARAPHRRNRALPLVSVMAADGQTREPELRFINAFLAEEKLAPIRPEEIRVHRPHEVGPVGSLTDRERICELMMELAHIDGEIDETEMRVIREYARAWGVDPARIDGWEKEWEHKQASRLLQFLRKVRSLFLV